MNQFTTALLLIAMFFLMVLFLQLSFNYAVPRMVHSVDKTYNVTDDFTALTYVESIVLAILLSLVFHKWQLETIK